MLELTKENTMENNETNVSTAAEVETTQEEVTTYTQDEVMALLLKESD